MIVTFVDPLSGARWFIGYHEGDPPTTLRRRIFERDAWVMTKEDANIVCAWLEGAGYWDVGYYAAR